MVASIWWKRGDQKGDKVIELHPNEGNNNQPLPYGNWITPITASFFKYHHLQLKTLFHYLSIIPSMIPFIQSMTPQTLPATFISLNQVLLLKCICSLIVFFSFLAQSHQSPILFPTPEWFFISYLLLVENYTTF